MQEMKKAINDGILISAYVNNIYNHLNLAISYNY